MTKNGVGGGTKNCEGKRYLLARSHQAETISWIPVEDTRQRTVDCSQQCSSLLWQNNIVRTASLRSSSHKVMR